MEKNQGWENVKMLRVVGVQVMGESLPSLFSKFHVLAFLLGAI